MSDVPRGFAPIPAVSGFLDLFGPVWAHETESLVAFRIEPRHLNRYSKLHGGAFAAFADLQALALGGARETLAGRVQTVSLGIDFLAAVAPGDWLEMAVTLTKETGSLLFTDGTMTVGGQIVGRTRGLYKKVRERPGG